MTLSSRALVIGFVTAGGLAYEQRSLLHRGVRAVERGVGREWTDSSDTAATASPPLAGAAARSPRCAPPGRLTTGADRTLQHRQSLQRLPGTRS